MHERDNERHTRLKAALRRCGICNQGPMFNWALRFGQVCDSCEKRAVDSKHRPIQISQTLLNEGGLMYVQNPRAYLTDAAHESGLPGIPCDEVNETRRCWIDGIECQIWEGRMGGIGLVVADFSQEQFKTPKRRGDSIPTDISSSQGA